MLYLETVALRYMSNNSSFDVKFTHHGEKPKKYLNARLNVQQMFEMFINDCPELTDIVKYSFYLSYFKENSDYLFGRPQVDGCGECEGLKVKLKDPAHSENANLNVAIKLCVHKRRPKTLYTALNGEPRRRRCCYLC